MIRIEHLSKSFRRTTVLHDINLEIDTGDRIALVGSNGAGKTTLMRCLLGEYKYKGSVTVNGLETRDNRARMLQRIGFVPQLPPPLKMPVGQLLQFAVGVCQSNYAKIEEVADQLGLPISSVRRYPFNKLSGGQKQKLLICIALGRDLDVLVLDEPAANLDPKARRTFFRLLAERHSNTSMLVSSHRLNEVATLVNRVVELDDGQVVIDDHVAASPDMNSVANCSLILSRQDTAFAKSIREWGFEDVSSGVIWRGEVSAADRLRFLGVLSRYASILQSIHLEDNNAISEVGADAHTI